MQMDATGRRLQRALQEDRRAERLGAFRRLSHGGARRQRRSAQEARHATRTTTIPALSRYLS